jgi:hypothetical protein
MLAERHSLPRIEIDLPAVARTIASSPFSSSYLIACSNHVIYRLDGHQGEPSRTITPFAGQLEQVGCQNGHKLDHATFNLGLLTGLCISQSGTVYVSEGTPCIIRQIIGDMVSLLAGTGSRGNQDGPATTTATFNRPYSIAFCESNSTLYVADSHNHTIRAVCNGMVSTLAGSSCGLQDGGFLDSKFYHPYHISISPNESHLYVSDWLNRSLRKLDLESKTTSTIIRLGQRSVCNVILPNGDLLATCDDFNASNRGTITSRNSFFERDDLIERDTSLILHVEQSGASTPELTSNGDFDLQPVPVEYPGIIKSSIGTIDDWNGSGQKITINAFHPELAIVSSSSNHKLLLLDATTMPFWTNRKSPYDLSVLLQDNAPLSDLHVINRLSGYEFHLHSAIINAYFINVSRFKMALENSQISKDALKYFVESLYSDQSSFFCSLTPNIDNATTLSHCIRLYNGLGIRTTVPMQVMKSRILPRLSGEELCELLLSMWNTGGQHHDITEMLIPLVRPHIALLMSEEPHPNQAEILDRIDGKLARRPSILVLPPQATPSSPLAALMRALGDAVDWKSRNAPLVPGFHRLSIPGHELVLDAPTFILSSKWPYTRRMITSTTLEDDSNRICEFPAEFPPELLLGILKIIHGVSYIKVNSPAFEAPLPSPRKVKKGDPAIPPSNSPRSVSVWDIIGRSESVFVLERGDEFGLISTKEMPRKPIPPFEALFRHARRAAFPPLLVSTCIEDILTRSKIGTHSEVEEAVEFACKNFPAVLRSHPNLTELISQLPSEMGHRIFVNILPHLAP